MKLLQQVVAVLGHGRLVVLEIVVPGGLIQIVVAVHLLGGQPLLGRRSGGLRPRIRGPRHEVRGRFHVPVVQGHRQTVRRLRLLLRGEVGLGVVLGDGGVVLLVVALIQPRDPRLLLREQHANILGLCGLGLDPLHGSQRLVDLVHQAVQLGILEDLMVQLVEPRGIVVLFRARLGVVVGRLARQQLHRAGWLVLRQRLLLCQGLLLQGRVPTDLLHIGGRQVGSGEVAVLLVIVVIAHISQVVEVVGVLVEVVVFPDARRVIGVVVLFSVLTARLGLLEGQRRALDTRQLPQVLLLHGLQVLLVHHHHVRVVLLRGVSVLGLLVRLHVPQQIQGRRHVLDLAGDLNLLGPGRGVDLGIGDGPRARLTVVHELIDVVEQIVDLLVEGVQVLGVEQHLLGLLEVLAVEQRLALEQVGHGVVGLELQGRPHLRQHLVVPRQGHQRHPQHQPALHRGGVDQQPQATDLDRLVVLVLHDQDLAPLDEVRRAGFLLRRIKWSDRAAH